MWGVCCRGVCRGLGAWPQKLRDGLHRSRPYEPTGATDCEHLLSPQSGLTDMPHNGWHRLVSHAEYTEVMVAAHTVLEMLVTITPFSPPVATYFYLKYTCSTNLLESDPGAFIDGKQS